MLVSRRSLLAAFSLLMMAVVTVELSHAEEKQDEAQREKWIQLFNGKNLDGWTPKIRFHEAGENYADTFRVVDGYLTVSYDKYPDGFKNQFGHLFYKTPYSHYRLRMEYRFIGDQCDGGPGWAFRNSGAMLHGEKPDEMELDQEFPTSIEVQLLGGEQDRQTANLCTPGTHVVMKDELIKRHCTRSTSELYPGEQWVTVEVEVHGNGIVKHIIDGETVLEYTKCQLDEGDKYAKKLIEKRGTKMLKGGTISLQSESHPVQFRKVELLVLEDEAKESAAVEPSIRERANGQSGPATGDKVFTVSANGRVTLPQSCVELTADEFSDHIRDESDAYRSNGLPVENVSVAINADQKTKMAIVERIIRHCRDAGFADVTIGVCPSGSESH